MANRKLKVGMSIWSVCAYPEDSVELSHYVIRSIKKPPTKHKLFRCENKKTKVYVVYKCSATWGKKSKKHGDYGWLKNIDEYFRDSFDLDTYNEYGLPKVYSFTQSGAYKNALSHAKESFKRVKSRGTYNDDPDYLKLYENMISKLKGLYTKSKNNKR